MPHLDAFGAPEWDGRFAVPPRHYRFPRRGYHHIVHTVTPLDVGISAGTTR